jgi:hypothetical protein
MPNWVYNTMNVTGDAEDVATFIHEMATPIPSHIYPEGGHIALDKQWETTETVFSFWNAVAPTDLEAYFTGDAWYNWNCANWGVKWDAKVDEPSIDTLDKYELVDGTGGVTYRFDTAWGTPTEVFQALAKKYPHLHISIEFEEEQGWGGEYVAEGGELSLVSEYDIPNSHADYAERGREDSCECSWGELDNMYDDCPAKMDSETDESKLLEVVELTSL